MLFNSYTFILLFLPVCLGGYQVIRGRYGLSAAYKWLTGMSLLFYAFEGFQYSLLVLATVVVNFSIAGRMRRNADGAGNTTPLLYAGIIFNLGLLSLFKYSGFIIENLNHLLGLHIAAPHIRLPPGISFYTFIQIAFLVDVAREGMRERSFPAYALFVTFFPHLIAGPILHHREMMPQFTRTAGRKSVAGDLDAGIAMFAIGLAKKVLLADTLAVYVSPVFLKAAAGGTPDAATAWLAVLAYCMQIYFDFSGYSDMAIALARMFGITFPQNFNSPYKSGSVIEFWRRWHITLSRFLKDYLYIPLGGNRRGVLMRCRNLLLTMLLGGLWHGAGWNFIIWGGLHGLYLVVNNVWRALATRAPGMPDPFRFRLVSVPLTFGCVAVAWVFFRAGDVETAVRVLRGMAGLGGGFSAHPSGSVPEVLAISLAIAFFLPNTQQIMVSCASVLERVEPAAALFPRWRPTAQAALATGLLLATALMGMTSVSEFIYFRF